MTYKGVGVAPDEFHIHMGKNLFILIGKRHILKYQGLYLFSRIVSLVILRNALIIFKEGTKIFNEKTILKDSR